MIGNLGIWEILGILLIFLLLFGAKRLPEIGSALGKGIREFKGSVKELQGGDGREIPTEEEPTETRKVTEEEKQA
jgi:sec-independent protein translocase protein TatA